MTEALLGLLPVWGPWLVGLSTLLSCLLLPIPASLMMIAAGAFVGAGDLSLAGVVAGALSGAVLGDQIGYQAGRLAQGPLTRARGKSAALATKAAAMLRAHGGGAVFLSRWLFSPLGPWTNLAAGAAGYGHARFTLAALIGEAVWVAIYVGLGMVFGSNLDAAADLAGTALGLMAAGAATLGFGWWLVQAARQKRATTGEIATGETEC